MSKMNPFELAKKIGEGLLSFPVTHFTQEFQFDENPYREHISWLLEHKPAGLFAAGGTGEFFSLTLSEFSSVVRAAVHETDGRVSVLAGCGYGTAMAKEFAKAAEDAGADGILLLPPYLVNSEAAGLAAHTEAICAATKLGVIFYNRDNAIMDDMTLARLCERAEPYRIQGWHRRHRADDPHLCPNRRPADLRWWSANCGDLRAPMSVRCGVRAYSSAIFNFLPNFAGEFYAAVRQRNHEKVYAGLREFVMPYIAIRNRRKGYAVSIVKAGMTAIGRPAGPVRSPLVDLSRTELEELKKLIGDRS